MKKLFSFAAMAAALCFSATSCNKDVEPEVTPGEEKINLVVDVRGNATKATAVTDAEEAKVNTLQIFVFNKNIIDGYVAVNGATEATVECSKGNRQVYAVVNAGDLSSVVKKEDLLNKIADLKSNSVDNFMMIGSVDQLLSGSGKVSITVERFASRILVKSVKNGLTVDAFANDFKLKGMYLTNVAGDCRFDKSSAYTVSKWYNRRGYEATNSLGKVDYDAIDITVAKGATNSTAHYFYSMPNANAEVNGTSWSPRRAKLVILVEIAGNLYHYPILLPELESNKSYEINLVNLSRLGNPDDGSNDPNDPDNTDDENIIEGISQGFEIIVKPWEQVLVNGDGSVTI